MKFIIQTILAIAVLIFVLCLPGRGQTNGTNGKIEPAKLVVPPDSIAIVSLKDYQTFFVWLQDNATKSQYDKLKPEDILIAFSEWAIREWNRKKKK